MKPSAGRALLAALLFLSACSHDAPDRKDAGQVARPVKAAPAGKLEAIERRQYPEPSRDDRAEVPADAAGEDGKIELIRIEGLSSGAPGLVLSRAMNGAQALGYTLLELDDRDLFFVAEKRASVLGTVLSGAAGTCKIAVGVAGDPDSGGVKLTLKGRPAMAGGRISCERDLFKVLDYGRGEVIVKPKKSFQSGEPGDVFRHGR